jgi:hypothetical protein
MQSTEFDRQFRADVVPSLTARSFTLDDVGLTFRRVVEHDATRSTQIVEFQVGEEGWAAGRFTVNLGVFNRDHFPADRPEPDAAPGIVDCLHGLTCRLGFFHQPRRNWVGRLLGGCSKSRDHWWERHDDPRRMRATFADVLGLLSTRGVDWLLARTTLTAFDWARREQSRRREWTAACAASNAWTEYEPEPFPGAP